MGNVISEFGRLVLGVGRDIQCTVMPDYTSVDPGIIVQYTGATDANYTNGYFYKCTNSGWELIEVQDVSDKANKVAGATTDDLAKLTATGDLADSGKKLSDLVLKSDVKDVLNSTSTTDPLSANQGRVLSEELSHRNLVDNSWFTVNQRGATTVTSGYGADRWKFTGGTEAVFSSNGVTLNNVLISQFYEKQLPNGVYTASARFSDGTIRKGTAIKSNDTSAVKFVDDADFKLTYEPSLQRFDINTAGLSSGLTVRAVKLEVGSASTLHLDVAPDYATELLKCQRYFYRFYITENTSQVPMANRSATDAYLTFDLPTELRATPTVSYTGSFHIIEGANIINVSSLTLGMGGRTKASGSATCAGGLTAGYASMLGGTSGSYIDFSADL